MGEAQPFIGHRRSWGSALAGTGLATVVALCGVLPLAWVVFVLLTTPGVWDAGFIDSFRLLLLGKTLLYNGAVAAIASVMAVPAALSLGRGPAWVRRILWAILPAGLLMPSLAYGYGWSQCFRLLREPLFAIGVSFDPGSWLDIARCVWTLAAWLWPIPAILVGLHLRRMGTDIQLQAASDGILWRMTLRQLVSPIVAAFAIVMLLATQEFAIYEPTGISVVATEVRMVFDSGVFSAMVNAPGDATTADQASRAALALGTALPLLICTMSLAALAAWLARRDAAAGEVSPGHWPPVLQTPWWLIALAALTLALTAAVPVLSLLFALKVPFSLSRIWEEFSPELLGAIWVGALTSAVAVALALAAIIRPNRWALAVLVLTFLLGGQMLAIASIRLWNRPLLSWAYDAYPVPVLVYLARFGWIALAVAGGTWSKNWRDLRMMAAVDGASAAQTAWHVLWPNVAPALAAAALLIGALSMTEVPATVLLQPQNPRVLTPMIMTWVHMIRYDPMIEAALLMMGVVLFLWILAALGARASSPALPSPGRKLARKDSSESRRSAT